MYVYLNLPRQQMDVLLTQPVTIGHELRGYLDARHHR